MMLDYFAYTDDRVFVKETLLPIAEAGITFFDQHFPHEGSKLLLDPDNAIEMYWSAQSRARYRRSALGAQWTSGLAARVDDRGAAPSLADDPRHRPGIAHGREERQQAALPAEKIDNGHNSENPELYAIYPFRLFGLGKPNLDLSAGHASAVGRFKNHGCWCQSGIQACAAGRYQDGAGEHRLRAHAQGQAVPALRRVLGSWLGLTCPTRTTAVTA